MSEEGPLAESVPERGMGSEIAGDGPGRGKRRGCATVALAVALVVVASCCGLGWLVAVYEMTVDLTTQRIEEATWTGDGRWVIVQLYDTRETAASEVVAMNLATDEWESAKGYRAVAVEPTGSAIWVVTDDESAALRYGDLLADSNDAAYRRLYRWDPAKGSEPEDVRVGQWALIPNGRGRSARMLVERRAGALPSSLQFVGSETSTFTTAVLPEDFGTFEPIGWSPSGRFFGVIETYGDAGITGDQRVLMIDGMSGAVSSRVAISGRDVGFTYAWDGAADVIWILDMEPTREGDAPNLAMLRPGAERLEPAVTPRDWRGAFIAQVLGRDGEGPVAEIGSDKWGGYTYWRLGSDGAVRVRDFGPTEESDTQVWEIRPDSVLFIDPSEYDQKVLVSKPVDAEPEAVWDITLHQVWKGLMEP